MNRCAWFLSTALLFGMVTATSAQSASTPSGPDSFAEDDSPPPMRKSLLVDLDVRFIDVRGEVRLLPERFRSHAGTVDSVLSDEELAHFNHVCRTDPRVKTLALPRLRVKTGTPGSFRRGREIPFFEEIPGPNSSRQPSTRNKTLFVGTALEATVDGPTRESLLSVKVDFEKSVLSTPMARTGSKPEVDLTHVGSNLLLSNGQTAVVGGMQTELTTMHESRVPVLGKLPVIGAKWFTRTRAENESAAQMLVVTPVVIEIEP